MVSRIDAYEVVEGSNDEVDKVSTESLASSLLEAPVCQRGWLLCRSPLGASQI